MERVTVNKTGYWKDQKLANYIENRGRLINQAFSSKERACLQANQKHPYFTVPCLLPSTAHPIHLFSTYLTPFTGNYLQQYYSFVATSRCVNFSFQISLIRFWLKDRSNIKGSSMMELHRPPLSCTCLSRATNLWRMLPFVFSHWTHGYNWLPKWPFQTKFHSHLFACLF